MTSIRFWRSEMARHPILVGWLVIFVVHAGLNAKLGHEMGGGEGAGAALYAAAFLGFAVVGAWAADQIAHAAGARRLGLAAIAIMQLVIGQMAGWQALGLTLSKGQGTLEAKADQRQSTKERLDASRAELAWIGIVRPVDAIRPDMILECEKKSKAFPDGIGPKCTGFRAELATAERARKLEADIERLTGQLREGPALKSASDAWAAPQALAQGVASGVAWVTGGAPAKITPDDVRFGWMVFLVFALEFFGTFGLALIRHGGGDTPAAGASGPGTPARLVPAPAGGGGGGGGGDPLREALDRIVDGLSRALPAPAPMIALGPPAGYDAASYDSAPRAYGYGAPISIHVSSSGTVPTAAHAVPATDPAGAAVSIAPPRPSLPREDLMPLSADAPPVDRSRVSRALSPEEREAADVILAFRAACIVDSPGGLVDAQHLVRRYQAWAGNRALAPEAFLALFADVSGFKAVDMGGLPHVSGLALRAAPGLKAVA
jgi:hypothetical protein